jgi:hypothetical protein
VIMANANVARVLFDEIKESVARSYEWPGYPIEPQLEAQPISRNLLERVRGKYQLCLETTAALVTRDGRLFLEIVDLGAVEVFAKSATELFAPAMGPITIQVVESEGKVTALKTSNGREYVKLSE